MSIWLAFKMAIKSVWNNKVRSLLTMLGVIIGVAAVIAAVGFAQSCMHKVSSLIEGMGSNVVTVMITDYSSRNNIKIDDLKDFAKSSTYIEDITPYVTKTMMVRGENGEEKTTSIIGANDAFIGLRNMDIIYGRNLSQADDSNMNKVAVLGGAVAAKFSPTDPSKAVGMTMKLNGNTFEIVGVLETTMNNADGTNDDMIIIPVRVAQRVLKISAVTMFMVNAVDAESIDLASQAVNKYLYNKFKDEDSYVIVTQEAMLSMMDQITDLMMLIIGGVATISLVVGGIGIMNIMFVSVTERTREIGIRKAIGAKKSAIMTQFVIEAMLLTICGGILGILLGVAIIKVVIGYMIDALEPVYSTGWIIASFTIATTIGMGFGIFPANKAATLNPIDALRNE